MPLFIPFESVLRPGSGGYVSIGTSLGDAIQITPNPTGATTIQVQSGVTSLTLDQVGTSTANGASHTFSAQSTTRTDTTAAGGGLTFNSGGATGAHGGSNTSGPINLNIGSAANGGTNTFGSIRFQQNGVTALTVTPNPTSQTGLTFSAAHTGANILFSATSAASGAFLLLNAQATTFATGSVVGGALHLRAGDATGAATNNTGGQVLIRAGGASGASGSNTIGTIAFQGGGSTAVTLAPRPTGSTSWTYDSAVTAVTHQQVAISSGTGATWTIASQTSNSGAGGALSLGGGSGTTQYGQTTITSPLNVGRATQAMADANQTLSVANSAKNQIFTTGALTAPRTLTISVSPTDGVMKFVRNNCTGDTVTFQFLTGTGVTLAPDTGAVICADGTNAVLLMGGT